jgi:hypothetical protein
MTVWQFASRAEIRPNISKSWFSGLSLFHNTSRPTGKRCGGIYIRSQDITALVSKTDMLQMHHEHIKKITFHENDTIK